MISDRELLFTPLSQREIGVLAGMGVQMWLDPMKGTTHILARWFNSQTPDKQEAIRLLISHWRSKPETADAA